MALLDGTHEDQPLLSAVPIGVDDEEQLRSGQLNFTKHDADNPLNWSPLFKWFIVVLLACMAFTV
jgi:hypothetical protein